jgi:hypothetical protein
MFGIPAVVGALLAVVALGGGMAMAAGPDYSGQTYAKAAEQISSGGGTAVIATVIGEQLATDDCLVTGSKIGSNLDSSGRSRGYQVLLDLNCNQTLAAPGKPGNSAATSEGKAEKGLIHTGDFCSAPAQADYTPCAEWCSQHDGYCTANF